MKRHAMRCVAASALLALVAGAPGCADDEASSASAWDASGWSSPNQPDNGSGLDAFDAGSPGFDAGPGGSDVVITQDAGPPPPPPPPPPQNEQDFDLRAPEAGLTRLFIPSAGLDAVVVVDAASGLDVSLVDAGSRPTLLKALPDDQGAVVLNQDSADVSIVRPAQDGGYTVENLDVAPNHNRIELSPNADWAFAWYDERLGGVPGSLNDVSAIRLRAGEPAVVFNLAVGMRPTDLFFADNGRLAIFEAENGLSGVDLQVLAQDSFLPPVPVHDDPFIEPSDREVVVSPDGQWAVVRELDRQELTLVNLASNTRAVIALPDYPSDLDITADGARVVVPFVNSQQVAVVQVPQAWEQDPTLGLEENPAATVSFTGHPFGSVLLSGDGARGLLYTTDAGVLSVGLLEVATGQVLVRPVAKAIKKATVDSDGSRAVLINHRNSGTKAPESSSNAYTIIDLDEGFEYLELTPAEPTDIVFTGDGDIYALIPDFATFQHQVHRVRSFAVTVYPVPQAPVYVGLLQGVDQAAVMLDDPTGWLTFIDLVDGGIDQVNSFELNSFIE